MNMNAKLLVAVAASGVCLTTTALALPINITVDNGALATVTPKGDNGLTNSGDATIFTWLSTYDIPQYESITSTVLPTPTTVGDLTAQSHNFTENSNGDITFNLDGTYAYIVFHWGASGGGVYQAYDIAGLNGSYTFLNPTGMGAGTISFDNLYKGTQSTGVPDGGSTLMLLGFSGLGIFLLARHQRRASAV